jgi:hypothetical protein
VLAYCEANLTLTGSEPRTIRRWIRDNEKFRHGYALAKDGLIEDMLEEIKEFAADDSKDFELVGGAGDMPVLRPNRESLGRSALKMGSASIRPRSRGSAALSRAQASPYAR